MKVSSISPRYILILVLVASAGLSVGCGKSWLGGSDEKRAQIMPNAPDEPAQPARNIAAASSGTLPAGTNIEVEVSDIIDSDTSPAGSFTHCTIVNDVKGPDGKIVLPGGSSGVVVVLDSGKQQGVSLLTVALYQLSIAQRSYLLLHGKQQLAVLERRENAAAGEGHRSVHIEKRARLTFTLSEATEFKK